MMGGRTIGKGGFCQMTINSVKICEVGTSVQWPS